MRIIDLDQAELQTITRFDSVGFMIGKITASTGPMRISQLRLDPGGVVGRHQAVGGQLLIPLDGIALVSGSDARPEPIDPHQAVLWDDGEEHETRSDSGLLALVIEGPFEL